MESGSTTNDSKGQVAFKWKWSETPLNKLLGWRYSLSLLEIIREC